MTNEDLYQEVINDLEISRKNFEADSSQFNRRTYIRTFVSFLEAFIDIFKNKLATEWQNSIIETTPELMANYLILIGKHPNLSGAGEAKLKDSRGNLLSLSKLTIRTYCQIGRASCRERVYAPV